MAMGFTLSRQEQHSALPCQLACAPSTQSARKTQTKSPQKDCSVDPSVSSIPYRALKGRREPLPLCQSTASRPSNASAIRSRFLNRLGISKEDHHVSDRKLKELQEGRNNAHRKVRSFQVALKGDFGSASEYNPCASYSPTSTASTFSTSSHASIRFEPTVTVHPIPMRNAYSDRIRSALWTSSEEMRENTSRNCLEFAAESWDWRKVADDEDMINYLGEAIHPVHFVRDCSLRQHFSIHTTSS